MFTARLENRYFAFLVTACVVLAHSAVADDWRQNAFVYQHPIRAELIDLGLVQNDPPIRKIKADSKYFWVFDGVIGPNPHSLHIWQFTEIHRGETVLDLGTGIGLLAIFAAESANRVIATDINPKAVENAKYNIERHGVEHIVSARQGDLFQPVENEMFDVIIANLPFPYTESEQPWWELHRRFFNEVGSHLNPNGRIYYQAGEINNAARIQSMIVENELQIRELHMLAPPRGRQPLVYVIRHANLQQ